MSRRITSPGPIAERIDLRQFVWAVAVLAMLVALAGFGLVTMAWGAPLIAKASRLLHTAVTAAFVMGGVLWADRRVERGLRPLPTYGTAIVLGAVIGSLVGYEIRGAVGLDYGMTEIPPRFAWVRRIDMILVCSIVGALATDAHVSRRQALAARRRQHAAEAARAKARRRTLESELQALQARVEPTFLFDTLDRIRRLYRSDATAAGSMLEDLIAYLRAALPHLRESASTVHQESALARAWLDIVGRSATGLRFALEVEPSARDARLPALVLLPLVQRAIGDGGDEPILLKVAVRGDDARLHVVVDTSTRAFAAGRDDAMEALAERLSALYGERATLETGASAAGSRAEVVVPLETMVEEPAP